MPSFESAILKKYSSNPDAAITISDQSDTHKVLVRSDRAQFGVAFGGSAVQGETLVCGSRPDEWLLLGSIGSVREAENQVDRDGFTNVIPFSHGRSLFRISGSHTDSMLEKVCGIDWSDDMTPDGAVVSASVALVSCDIIRNDLDGVRSYLIMCDRSFGQYLFDALIDAGDEFEIWNY